MQLFFGYIENYSFAAAGVLAWLWLGLRVLAGRQPLWLAATLLAVLNATHPSTVILLPSLLYLGWRCYRGAQTSSSAPPVQTRTPTASSRPALHGRNKTLLRVVGEMALPMLLIGGATFVWMEASGHGLYALFNTDRPGGGDARWFVPLWETSTRWERYTLLSWPHVRDWLNGQLLVAPVVLPGLLITAVSLWLARREHGHGAQLAAPGAPTDPVRSELRLGVRTGRESAESGDGPHARVRNEQGNIVQSARPRAGGDAQAGVRFLLVAAGFYLLFTFVWNPDYGGQRDWDLFSLAALPATVLLAVLLPRALPDGRWLRAGAVPLLVLQGWHTFAWIVQNTLPWEWPD
jgi:hypothetical protein